MPLFKYPFSPLSNVYDLHVCLMLYVKDNCIFARPNKYHLHAFQVKAI